MVSMTAGNELDPVSDSLAPVIALTRALWSGWMPRGTLAKCIKAAQTQQRRMQWTILEHDPFLWCMHDGRTVDPRKVCPHSKHFLLKQAARAWQLRRGALHEGYEGLDRGAVFAPLLATLHSPRLGTLEQAYLRSVLTGSGPSNAGIARSVATKKAA